MNGWEIKKLGDVYDVRDGTHDSPKYQPEGYALITSKNLKSNGLSFDNIKYISESDYKKINERSAVHKGDILLAMIGTIGNPIVVEVEPEFAIKNVALIKVPRNQSSYFLKYYLETEYVQSKMQREAKGTTQKFIGLGYLRDFPLALPPSLHEQKRIVEILDEAFEGIDRAIANTEKNLTNARELFESYLNEIFTQKGDGWEERTLREVSSEFGRGKSKHRPRNDPKLYGGSYPFIQTGDVRNCNHFITQSSQFYSEIGLAQSKLWPQGTICITIAANIAETGILGFDACFPDSIIGIVVDDKVTSNNFVEYLLQSVKARIKAKGQGSAQDNINLATFENERFPFPSLEQQKFLVSKLNKLSSETQHLEVIYRKKIDALNELKQSILQKAFMGELTADTANQAIEAAEEDRSISKDCLRSTETTKQNVHPSGQLSLWS
jgi:type I restriction enzyme, S subunit